jgi:outer membrane protein OmpA-like peptidoglycan-associated protein
MNTSTRNPVGFTRILAASFVISMIATGCALKPVYPEGSAEVRSKLDRLRSDPELAGQAPIETREAEAAVVVAEQSIGTNYELGEHRVFIADRKVAIAMARARTGYVLDQRAGLSQARDAARSKSALAQAEAEKRVDDASRSTAKMQQQIDLLEAEATARGQVLTLGNTLFATGRSDMKSIATSSLDKLVVFLNDFPDRNVTLEGHTDDVGSVALNQTLSRHRADAVKSYLVTRGIQDRRITAKGIGMDQPIADNLTSSGRQQNRRVEVIIDNPPSAIPATSKL